MKRYTLPLLLALTGCASAPPDPGPVEYVPIPEGYLTPCELPQRPTNNGELSEAFVIAYKCGEQGNRDKARIRELTQR